VTAEAPVQTAIEIEVPERAPYFDIEVVSDLHLDEPAPADGTEYAPDQLSSMRSAVAGRLRRMREAFRNDLPRLVVVCGDGRVEAAEDGGLSLPGGFWRDAVREAVSPRAGDPGPELLVAPAEPPGSVARPDFAVFRVRIRDKDEPHAYVVVATLPSPDTDCAPLEDLVRGLATGEARNVPLYLIGATHRRSLELESITTSGGLLKRCQRLRTSILLAGGLNRDDVPTVSSTSLDPGEWATELAVVPCPPFKSGVGTPGVARLRVDVQQGEGQIAFSHDLGSDHPNRPVQVVHRLDSVSRVSASERRLYELVHQLLDGGRDQNQAFVDSFRRDARDAWNSTGYAALTEPSGSFGGLPETERKQYFLLLLLRQRPDGGYDILLNHHTPLRPSALADWSTLLFPAFSRPRELLERLRDDVMRQAVERAEDLERADHARDFARAVERFLERDSKQREQLWADQVREIARMTTRKISPTDGCVTEFDYRLVTLLPLVERHGSSDPEHADVADKIIEWLQGLETIRPPGHSVNGSGGISIETLAAEGAGLRWNPEVELVRDPPAAVRRRTQKVPPGAVWFPLDGNGVPPWRDCPSIASRNADVMTWVENVLRTRLEENDGGFPAELVLGQAVRGRLETYEITNEFRFDADEGPSTTSALRKVKLNPDYDLADELAYPPPVEIRRVWLVKREVPTVGGHRRHGIFVYGADGFSPDAVDEIEPMGRLRPVQRYVLKGGIERAEDIERTVRARVEDKWGFACVRRGNAPRDVAVTPPIIESLHPDDWSEASGPNDFVLCDGNHRVIHKVWRQPPEAGGGIMPAVAAVGPPPHPYYARPFGALEWDLTSDNELVWSPDTNSKYLPRKVRREELDEANFKALKGKRDEDLFRRYYRSLETGFGPMGGQGGRFF
jgi:hypothetical protein